MLRLLRPRSRARIAAVAVAALLWSQLALAGHVDCPVMAAPAEIDHAEAMAPDCARSMLASDEALCSAHCGQGEASNEAGRVPTVPPTLCATAPIFLTVAVLKDGTRNRQGSRDNLPRPGSWHRPTSHPADLLLI